MSDAHETAGRTTLEKEPPAGSGQDTTSAAAGGPQEGAGGHAGRFWSVRRGPGGIVALLLLAGAAVLLYDVVSVRAGRPGMAWRRNLAGELAGTRLDSAPVLAGAAVAALLGLWLLVLALTPGRRSLLTMRRDAPQVRAGLERSAAALVLRDRAMEVSGVRSARVKVKRRKAVARAQAHFRDLDEVRSDLEAALAEGVEQLGLAHRLGLSVHVRRPAKR
ncbi:DUF6286 domain-containing protein [Streptomyces iconiensis]|uniref:DUF6286 domain-containing protein n=1 Tax=Streptomyces iconiensis TaxID=1384038 RepID=A0ABT6ZVE8_9ACTN|nr:DUF6286 domain-containing protein [Streptomyces iconiensis]MDJ1133052.1 DUF6286 domain-containing protein [Streptomyces iconiensis]